jgi:hypothetical protein
MRTLAAALEAEQKKPSAVPYVKALFDDFWGDKPRLRFSRFYTGSEAEQRTAAAVAPDGSLLRARMETSSGKLFTSRVTSPGSGSTYSTWGTDHGTVHTGCNPAFIVQGSNVWLFYVQSDTLTLVEKLSTDNGATWGSASTVHLAGSAIAYLAAAASATKRVIFWGGGTALSRRENTGGGWSSAAAWTNTVATIQGIAADYVGDFNLIVCGTEVTSTDPKAWAVVYGDGFNVSAGTWSGLNEIASANAGSNVTFISPALEFFEGQHRAWFVEKYTGSIAFNRLHFSQLDDGDSPTDERWTEPVGFDYQSDFGVSCAISDVAAGADVDGFWLVAAAGVWFAGAPADPFDASADVLEASVDIEEDGGRVRLLLDNSHGRYNMDGQDYPRLVMGQRLKLSFGFRTPSGILTSDGPGYWVTSTEHLFSAHPEDLEGRHGTSTILIEARDAWYLLDRWRARRQFQWPLGDRNIFQLISFVFTRAGLTYSGSGSSGFANLEPAFTIHPGESGATAVKRLLEKVPDVVRIRSGAGLTVHPQAADASVYAYGINHKILGGRHLEKAAEFNRIRVFGNAVFAEAFDFAEQAQGIEALLNVNDLNITTTGQATDRADYELRRVSIRESENRLVVPMNCGQEIYDVVEVTDPVLGYDARKRRVLALQARFRRAPARYELALTLGAL